MNNGMEVIPAGKAQIGVIAGGQAVAPQPVIDQATWGDGLVR